MDTIEREIRRIVKIHGEKFDIKTLPTEMEKAVLQAISERIKQEIEKLKIKRDIEIVKNHTTLNIAFKANELYQAFEETVAEPKNPLYKVFLQIAYVYHLGIIEGKRQDRARRKKAGEVA